MDSPLKTYKKDVKSQDLVGCGLFLFTSFICLASLFFLLLFVYIHYAFRTVFQTVFCLIILQLLYFLFKCVSGPTLGNMFISKKFHTVPRKVFLCSDKQNSEQPIFVTFYLFSMALRWNNLLVSFFFLAQKKLHQKEKKK